MSRLYPCAYCTEDGYCKKYSDEEVTSWCSQGPCKDEKPSNADRIRAMTDEELAELLWNRSIQIVEKAAEVVGFSFKCDREKCLSNVLRWLKQEVESNDS